MPTSNDMRKVLDIQDKHIIFEENCVTFGERRKKKAKFIHCTLTYLSDMVIDWLKLVFASFFISPLE